MVLQMDSLGPFTYEIGLTVFTQLNSIELIYTEVQRESQSGDAAHFSNLKTSPVRDSSLCYPPQLAHVDGPKVCCQVRDDHLTHVKVGRKVKGFPKHVRKGLQVNNLKVGVNG